jgi:hypothetical protein
MPLVARYGYSINVGTAMSSIQRDFPWTTNPACSINSNSERHTLRNEKLEAIIERGDAQVYMARRLKGARRQGMKIARVECWKGDARDCMNSGEKCSSPAKEYATSSSGSVKMNWRLRLRVVGCGCGGGVV